MATTTVDRVMTILRDPLTGPLVEEYFRNEVDGRPLFTGAWFERIGNGGDRDDVCNVITSEDLIAVEMLSVTIPPQTSVWLLGRGADDVERLLEQIPPHLSPQDEEGVTLLRDDNSPLGRLWGLFRSQHDVGWVKAGKLCARKRPALAPVYDQHVKLAVGLPERWWDAVCDLFADEDVVSLLTGHQEAARRVGGEITLLRVLDVAIWMRQHGYRWACEELRHPPPLQL